MNIVLLGAPGAGKGTQAQRLAKEFGFARISTGDLLRIAVQASTSLGRKAQSFMEKGQLVPDQLVVDLVRERLAADDTEAGFILDGFPRNAAQAVTLDAVLSKMNRSLDAALFIDVTPEVVVNRLKSRRSCRACGYAGTTADTVCPVCGGGLYQRDDDAPETAKKRLAVYETATAPLVEYYSGHGILHTIDGNRLVDEVYADVKAQLAL